MQIAEPAMKVLVERDVMALPPSWSEAVKLKLKFKLSHC
jgi:hypothetical protein